MPELDSRYVVKSVSRAIAILEALEDSHEDGLTVTEVAKIIGISKSAAFATLYTLRSHGFVSDRGESSTRKYSLGLALVRLGQQASAQNSIADLAKPTLRDLSERTGLTSRVAVLDDGWAVVVGRVDARTAVRLDLGMGRQEWPHCSGVGKAMLSTLPEATVRSIVERLGMPKKTANTITDVNVLLAALERADADGFCLDDEEDVEGVLCIAAPISHLPGGAIGAVSVTGLKADPLLRQPRRVGREVRAAAAEIAEIARGRGLA
jgi:IclR family acetate operon transcriptional repressor